MNDYEFCADFLNCCEDINDCSEYIDDVLACLNVMDLTNRNNLIEETPAAGRFTLLDYYFRRVGHELFKKNKCVEGYVVLNFIYLIVLDNFDEDYRQSTLIVHDFLKNLDQKSLGFFQKKWTSISGSINSETALRMDCICRLYFLEK